MYSFHFIHVFPLVTGCKMAGQLIASVLNWASQEWEMKATKLGSEADEFRKAIYLQAWTSYVNDYLRGDINLRTYAKIHHIMYQDRRDFLLMIQWLGLY